MNNLNVTEGYTLSQTVSDPETRQNIVIFNGSVNDSTPLGTVNQNILNRELFDNNVVEISNLYLLFVDKVEAFVRDYWKNSLPGDGDDSDENNE